jgi:hypothetical protein
MVKPQEGGFAITGRGMAGTPHTTHKRGAKIRHFFGRFCMFTPIPGSELFFKIARDTAKAYNEGGFEMIYLDAIDGLGRHLQPGEETWYWFQTFVHRIVSQCERTPIVETSSGAPQEWNVRGRTGAWDTANRSIKKMIQQHMQKHLRWMKPMIDLKKNIVGMKPMLLMLD